MTSFLEQALVEVEKENWLSAENALREALATDPNSPDTQYLTGLVNFRLGRLADARSYLQRCIELSPRHALAYFYLSGTSAGMGDATRATEELEAYLSLAPEDAGGWLRLGKLLSSQGLFVRAIDVLQRAIDLSPTSAEVQWRLGLALFNARQFSQAIPTLDAVLDHQTYGLEALRLSVVAFEEMHQWADAADRASQLAKRLPDDTEAKLAIARNLFLSGDESAGMATYREFLAVNGTPIDSHAIVGARVVTTESWEIMASRWIALALATESHRTKVRIRPSLTRHDKATVISPEWLVLTQNGDLLVEQMVHNPESLIRKSRHVRALSTDRCLLDLPTVAQEINDACILVGGCHDYYHWLVDYLPRIGVAFKVPALRDLKLIVNADLVPFQRESLTMLGITEDRLVGVPADTLATCRVIWVPTLLSQTAMTHHYVTGWLRRSLLTKELKQASPRRLLISPRGSTELINSSELAKRLHNLGFEVITPSQLSFASRVATFATAEAIISPTDPELANIIFAPAGALVVELSSHYADATFFSSLTKHLNQTYLRVRCRTVGHETGAPTCPQLVAPVDDLCNSLQKVLNRP